MTVLPYVLAVLLVPMAIGLMLFAMGRIEDQPTSSDRPRLRLPRFP